MFTLTIPDVDTLIDVQDALTARIENIDTIRGDLELAEAVELTAEQARLSEVVTHLDELIRGYAPRA